MEFARKKRTKVKKTSEFTGKSSKMKGKYQKKKENTWETQKTKKNPKKNEKKSKINLAPILRGVYLQISQSFNSNTPRSGNCNAGVAAFGCCPANLA